MSDPFTGEIRMFAGTYEPMNWAFCDGRTLNIQDNPSLFSLIGAVYGGDGTTTFALPDLRGRVAVHAGAGTGLTPRTVGQKDGKETVALTPDNLPAHTHPLQVTQNMAGTGQPGGKELAKLASGNMYIATAQTTAMNASAISATNSMGQAHNNVQPFLGINFIICLNGIYPPRQ